MSFVLKLRTIFINNVCTRKLKKENNHVLQKKWSHIGLFTLVIHLFCKENHCKKCEYKTVVLLKNITKKVVFLTTKNNPCTSSNNFLSDY